ncbi:MAG: hypothetical protein ABH829_00810 [archaeon]
METVFLINAADKEKVKAVLDPLEKGYFRGSYDFKDPKSLGFSDSGLYLTYKAEDALVKKLAAELKPIAPEAKNAKDILAKILADEESANAGLGAIFG